MKYFNSTIVRLKLAGDIWEKKQSYDFNSTIVRLKLFTTISTNINKVISILQ